MNWRLNLDPSTRAHLERQLTESGKSKSSYLRAKNPGNAQLWCAISNLSMKLFDMSLKLNYLEKVLKDSGCCKEVKEIVKKKTVKRKKK